MAGFLGSSRVGYILVIGQGERYILVVGQGVGFILVIGSVAELGNGVHGAAPLTMESIKG